MKARITFLFLFFVFTIFSQEVPEMYLQVWEKVNHSFGDETVKTELETLRKKNPDDPWIYWISGINCNPVTEKAEAIAFYKQAIIVDDKFPHAYLNLAQELEHETAKQISGKIRLLTKGIKLGCSDYAYLIRSEMYLLQKRYIFAMNDWESASKSDELDKFELVSLYVKISSAQGNKEEVHQFLKEFDFSGGVYDTNFEVFLAETYLEMNDRPKACYWFERVSETYFELDTKLPSNVQNGLNACD